MLSQPFGRITYTDAIKLLENASKNFEVKPVWGQDLRREHEYVSVYYFLSTNLSLDGKPTWQMAFLRCIRVIVQSAPKRYHLVGNDS